MATKTYDFEEQLNFSNGIDVSSAIFKRMRDITPNAEKIIKANIYEDKQGTDYWIVRANLPNISIDVKHRSFCPIQRFGSDDACIETCSVYTGKDKPYLKEFRQKIGWTLDIKKRTDWIVYTWPNENLLRYWIVYFPWLCKASRINCRKWVDEYGEREAQNKNYITLSVYPPRKIIEEEINKLLYSTVPTAVVPAAGHGYSFQQQCLWG